MDFMSRGTRSGQPASQSSDNTPNNVSGNSSAPNSFGGNKSGNSRKSGFAGSRIGGVVLLFSITVLIIAVIASLFLSKPAASNANEFKNVDESKLQAVFLNGGQVYFGNIDSLNSQFMRVSDIYYLRVNQQVQPDQQAQQANNDISLVKLGCELHGPTDSMIINREQVIFWENLKDDGQVAQAVAEFKKQNPEGQDCEQPQAGGTEEAGSTTPPATPPAANPPATPPTPGAGAPATP